MFYSYSNSIYWPFSMKFGKQALIEWVLKQYHSTYGKFMLEFSWSTIRKNNSDKFPDMIKVINQYSHVNCFDTKLIVELLPEFVLHNFLQESTWVKTWSHFKLSLSLTKALDYTCVIKETRWLLLWDVKAIYLSFF